MVHPPRKERLKERAAYAIDNSILDDLLGPLEIALEQSDHQIEQERAIANDREADPTYEPPDVECKYCHKTFLLTTWYIDIHIPRCEEERKDKESELPQEMKCPQCKVIMARGTLLSHLRRDGELECREYWRALTVADKRAVHPEFDLDRHAERLSEAQNNGGSRIQDLSAYVYPQPSIALLPVQRPSLPKQDDIASVTELTFDPAGLPDATADKKRRTMTPAYCPNCGTSVVKQEWFLVNHLPSCIEKVMRSRTLNSFDPATGMRVQSRKG